jgi:hypothetical protein
MKEHGQEPCASPLAQALLQAGRQDRPSDDARMKAALAIGVVGTVATTATVGGAAGGATGTAVASKWLGSAGLIKLLGATVAGGALVVGAVSEPWRTVASAPAPAPHAEVARAHARSAAPATPARPQAPSPVDHDDPVALPVLAEPSASPRVSGGGRRAARVTPVDDDAALRGEVQRLDCARAALAAGDAARAQTALAVYDRTFPSGALREEADLLRIEALAQSGDTIAAKVRAEALLARDPSGPHARRLRALFSLPRGDRDVR